MGTLTEGIKSALSAAGITIMKKKTTFGKGILACYSGELSHRKANKFDHLLLFSRAAGPLAEGIADFEIMCKTQVTFHRSSSHAMHSSEGKCNSDTT